MSARALVAWMALAGACRAPVQSGGAPPAIALARLLRIEDTRRTEPAFLDSLLDGADMHVRARAALTVGRLGARRHAGQLRRLATSPDSVGAATALFSLGLLRDTAAVPQAVAALRRDDAAGAEAAWLLGEVGARAALVAGLSDAGTSQSARGALLLAAARLRPVPAEAVVPHLASGDSAIAWRAAYAIARGRSPAGVRALLARASAPWSTMREQVARGAIRALAGDSLELRARAVLAPLAMDTNARVRIAAVRALGSYGAVERVAVVTALGDRDAGVRLTAAQALELVLDSSLAAWDHAMTTDTSLVVQHAIADAARRRGLRLMATSAWENSADWRRRSAAVQLASRASAATAVGALEQGMRDRDGRVRAEAAVALGRIADSGHVRDRMRLTLRGLLTDADVGVRNAALTALSRGATMDDLATAFASYELARSDVDGDARLAFWVLTDSALRRTDRAIPDSVARRLAMLSRPADPLERNVAARVARFASWRDSTGTARPMEWYHARAREALGRPPMMQIETERGVLRLLLYVTDAPLTVFNIVTLARARYFDGQRWHRVVPNFVVQGGDPRGDGNGGPGYAIRDELNRRRYGRGILGMALSGPHTGGSQFFVTHSAQPHLDGGYTVFGELVSGGEVLDAIVQGDRIVRITVR